MKFTPHARGSTAAIPFSVPWYDVYPACAGIDPALHAALEVPGGLPRMRGDRPCSAEYLHSGVRFTPHARGSTCRQKNIVVSTSVYPACAGIDPILEVFGTLTPGLPRMRGDRPAKEMPFPETLEFTPHARGSTFQESNLLEILRVYPACAGIDRSSSLKSPSHSGLPRMRGDRPR